MLSHELVSLGAYALAFLGIWSVYTLARYRNERRASAKLADSREAGLTDPDSLHPAINENRCLGCGSCVTACPEGDVLGIIAGKAQIVDSSHCIGHGACKLACPTDAIELVLGSEKRGVDVPSLGPDFQTNVPGVFVAGELGGMGLIRNAIEQGRQAMESVAGYLENGSDSDSLDVVIIGAGPAGLSASLGAMERKLRFVTLEQECFGGTVAHFPRGKIVMTAPVEIPMIGTIELRETTKEALLSMWEDILKKTGLEIQDEERVESVTPSGEIFEVKTSKDEYRARAIVLAIGRRGTPRKLGVEGEDRTKVVYRLIDPAQYEGQHVLVVGGGDSAVEAALAISQQPDTCVTLSYRGEAFKRIKPGNREALDGGASSESLHVALESNVKMIDEKSVTIEADGACKEIQNDGIIVCAGGVLPTDFLKSIGIEIATKRGTPLR
ncbi:MAG: NAD(P)-binding domain-containing protein [Myxococcales bacterium]|nr:NAD(P)-binding domain-containing protein [Myxococcales bacterium]